MEPRAQEHYLGDAVYASFDGYHIWLRTGDGNNQKIALEPAVFQSLVAYAATTGVNVMGRAKDLWFETMKRRMNDLIDSGMSEECAYEAACEQAQGILADRMADMADNLRKREKENE